jgi:hypothetical protein
MLTLPAVIVPLLTPFAPMFQARTWMKVQVLLIGTILATRKRTVTSALRTMGLSDDIGFARHHHVLNRAEWSPLQLSRVLLSLLVQYLDGGDSPLVFGIDETLERRRGSRIKAKGIYRDAVRSSGSHFVKASGLRWISLMLLTNIPWAHRTWALPVLTALAPSERYCHQMGRTHKRLIDWARQMIIQVRRWLPNRPVVMVADSSYAALDLLAFCQSMTRPVTFITRLRLDAALYEPAPPRLPGQMGRPRLKGRRLPTLAELLECPEIGWTVMSVAWYDGATRVVEVVSQTAVWYHAGKPPVSIRWVIIRDPLHQFDSQALLCTDSEVSPVQIIEWFVLRWQVEVTFQEARAHLGLETQRQWSDRAISRTTPVLLGLFSWITLAAHLLGGRQLKTPRSAAWYVKSVPTFVDAIALVRRHLWFASESFCMSSQKPNMRKIPTPMLNRFMESLTYAA